jgi:hypothetical protein
MTEENIGIQKHKTLSQKCSKPLQKKIYDYRSTKRFHRSAANDYRRKYTITETQNTFTEVQ